MLLKLSTQTIIIDQTYLRSNLGYGFFTFEQKLSKTIHAELKNVLINRLIGYLFKPHLKQTTRKGHLLNNIGNTDSLLQILVNVPQCCLHIGVVGRINIGRMAIHHVGWMNDNILERRIHILLELFNELGGFVTTLFYIQVNT